MALTAQEQRLVILGKQAGKSAEEIKRGIYNLRTGYTPKPAPIPVEKAPTYGETITEDLTTRADKVANILSRDTGALEKGVQVFGQGAGAAATAIESLPVVKQVLGAAGSAVDWISKTKPVQYLASKVSEASGADILSASMNLNPVTAWATKIEPIKNLISKAGETSVLQELTTLYDTDKDFRDTVDGVANIARLGGDIQGVVDSANFTKNVTKKLAEKTVEKTTQAVEATKSLVPEPRSVAQEILDIENNYVKTRNINKAKPNEAEASALRIEESNVLPNSVNENGLLDTKSPGKAYDQYKKQVLEGTESIGRKTLAKEGATISVQELYSMLKKEVANSGLSSPGYLAAMKGLKDIIRGMNAQGKVDALKSVKLADLHDEKIATANAIDWNTPAETRKGAKAVARGLRKAIEIKSKTNIAEINERLEVYLGDLERIANLDGKRVRGGKLSKYTAQIGGNVAGALVGNALGGPIAGAMGTVVGGEVASAIRGRQMASTFGKDTGTRLPKDTVLEQAKQNLLKPKERDPSTPDPKVGVSKRVPKTDEVVRLEGEIAQNVEAQKRAIKAGDFELVAKLKEIYDVLIQKLRDIIDKYEKLPNKQGGFARIKFSDAEYDRVAKALEKYDTTPATVDGAPMIEKVDVEFRLEQLKTKLQRTSLSKDEIAEAKSLLEEVGAIDAGKPSDIKGGQSPQPKTEVSPSPNDTTASKDMQADTSAPFDAPYSKAPDTLMGFSKETSARLQKVYGEQQYKFSLPVKITFKDGTSFTDEIKGLNKSHALERARRNWDGAEIQALDPSPNDTTASKDMQADTSAPFEGRKVAPLDYAISYKDSVKGGVHGEVPLSKLKSYVTGLKDEGGVTLKGKGAVDIEIDADGGLHILDGNHRIQQAIEDGYTHIPARIQVDKGAEAFAKEFTSNPSPLLQEAKKYKSAEDFVKAQGNFKTPYDWNYLDEMERAKNAGEGYSFSDYSALSNLAKKYRGNEPSEPFFRAGSIDKSSLGEKLDNIYLTDNESLAQQYASGSTKVDEYRVFAKKPLEATDSDVLKKILGERYNELANSQDLKQKLIKYAKDNGYDSVRFPDSGPDGEGIAGNSLVVFDKSLVKTRSQLLDIWKKANNK